MIPTVPPTSKGGTTILPLCYNSGVAYLEKDFQTEFSKWLKYNFKNTAVFELKLARTKSLPFSAVEEHQINALYNAKHAHIVHKLPDTGYQNPFDCFFLKGVEAYVVVMFTKQKKFFMIDIDDFLKEKSFSERKSITEERAQKIGRQYALAKN